jgi:hypothetical protein
MQKRRIVAPLMMLAVILVALAFLSQFQVSQASWPYPDYDCVCDHTHEGYADDEWTATGLTGSYSNYPFYQSACQEFVRGSGGTYSPVGNMMCDRYIDSTHYYNEVGTDDWVNYDSCAATYLSAKTRSTFPIPGEEGHYQVIGTSWAQVYASP